MANAEAPVELTEEDLRRKNLILRNLQEALGTDKLVKQLSTPGKNVHLYWGTATTGRPHVGYMVPMQKIADFLNAGLRVTILFADVHAFLDNLKSTFEMLDYRVAYYEYTIKALLNALNVPLEKLHFVRGSSYQLSEPYTKDILRLCGNISQRDALRAGAEVVKQVDSPLLSGLLYPLLQAVDEQYLKVDGQCGGVDQRKIFILAEEQLPKIKLGKRWHLMNPMVPGLTGGKMSSSEIDSKIDLLDSPEIVAKKIDGACCEKGNPDDNGVLAFFHFVLLPIVHPNSIELDGKSFATYEEIKTDFESGALSEKTLKDYLKTFLINVLEKVQEQCKTPEMAETIKKAYPTTFEEELSENLKSRLKIEEDKENKKLAEIKDNLKLISSSGLEEKLNKNEPVKVLWRVSTKGRVNLGHIAGLIQLKRLQKLGCKCSVLISDIGGYLDNGKCPWNALEARAKYYEEALKQLAAAIGLTEIEFLHSSKNEFQESFTLDMYKIASKVTRDDSAIIKGNTLATHLWPIYFTLDIHYADADLIITGEEQKPFVDLANQLYDLLKMPQRAALFFSVIPGMNGEKMSASNSDFRLDLLDTAKQVKTKIGKSFCEPGNLEGNVALELAKLIIFPLEEKEIIIERPEEYGGNVVVPDYKALEDFFATQKIHPSDLKPMVTNKINAIIEPARAALTPQTKLVQAAFPKVK
ncbi:hypothetical protein FO519_001057 [Halicephalobus sp. NKZ332]|nr:hypothetical protein FO519_001057 [Halicephalobus sp. NKZ332]